MNTSAAGRPFVAGLITVSQMGSSNRVGLLYALAEHGPTSRSELARMAGVPRGSIAPIVAGLIKDGILIELEPTGETPKVGKPSRPLWFGPRIGHAGTVRIEAGVVECARVDQRGQVRDSAQAAFGRGATTGELEDLVLKLAQEVFDRATGPLTGIGLVWPAVWDRDTGRVLSCTPIPALEGSQLVERLEQQTSLEVFVEDDARALSVGQRWFGQARNDDSFAAVQISAGIGAGLIVDGRLFSIDDQFPEIGHMVVDVFGEPCRCGRTGCWETIAGLGWLRQQARRHGLANWATVTPGYLVTTQGPQTKRLLDSYARNIGIGLANIAIAFGISRFILHGEVVSGGPTLLDQVRRHTAAQCAMPGTGQPTIDLADSTHPTALLGAAAMPLVHAIERA
ncbi:MAG: ROK family transcriptional regulator [Micrococcales bacterium]|nr:ROK family transcriptional regulator [Micrococcales bacterium]